MNCQQFYRFTCNSVVQIMTPSEKVKIALQCILVVTFVSLCILSFRNLLKADTSLAFRKENSAVFPWIKICPLSFDLKPIDSFENISNISIRDYLKISIVSFDQTNWNEIIINDSKNVTEYFGLNEIFQQKIVPRIDHDKFLISNCTTLKTSFNKNKVLDKSRYKIK